MFNIYNKNGQIILIFAFMVMVMFSFSLLIVHVSTLTRNKIQLQLAADSSALAMATFQARSLNSIADRNYLLKYPSGDEKRTYHPEPMLSNYKFPGIDQISDDQYTFSSEEIFVEYIGLISPVKEQQNKFELLYNDLIPMIADEYIVKNCKDAFIIDKYKSPFYLKNKEITAKYIDWKIDATGNTLSTRKHIDAWTEFAYKRPVFSYITLGKKLYVWDREFTLITSASAGVTTKDARLWPDPKPTFNSRIIPTGDDNALH